VAFWGQSIRVRLTFWYSILVLSTLLLFFGLSYYFTSKTLSENLDISLKNEVRWVRDFLDPQANKVKPSKSSIDALLRRRTRAQPPVIENIEEDSTAEESDEIWNQIIRRSIQSRKKTYIQFADRRGVIYHRSFNLGTDSLAIRDTVGMNSIIVTTGDLDGEPIRIAAARTRNFTYLVGYPLSELADLLESLYIIFLILILPILMLCLMRPVNKNTKLLFPTPSDSAEQIAVLFLEECKNET